MKSIILTIFLFSLTVLSAQDYYYPENNNDNWESLSFQELGWCEDALDDLLIELDNNETKAFIVLKSGKIVIEEYLDDFKQDSSWIWFSAGKSLTSFLMGLAQEQGGLDINDPSKNYLGEGWSSLNNEQESKVLLRHHMCMTTGLDYTAANPFCTDRECLTHLNDAGSHWYYHISQYSLLRKSSKYKTREVQNL